MDPVAAGGFSSAAAVYARIRPGYARPAIGRIAEIAAAVAGGPSAAGVLDVGAGTGILTGQLSRAGLACRAVEPLAAMAAHLRRSLPSVPVAAGLAEALPVASGSVDVVTVAQAFHWFDAPAALGEAHRALDDGGALVLVWNVRDDTVAWLSELGELIEARTGGRPYEDHRKRSWSDVVAAHGGFEPLSEHRWPNPVQATRSDVVDRLASTSFVADLGSPACDDLLAEATALLAARPELDGTFEFPHDTVVYHAHRS